MTKITAATFCILAISLAAVATGPSHSQTVEKTPIGESKPAPSAEEAKAARRLLKATGQLQQLREELQNVVKFQAATKEGEEKELLQALNEAMSNEENIIKLEEIMVEKIASHFSIEDLNQLADFFESPLGRRFSEKQSIIVTEAEAAAKTWGRQLGAQAAQRLKKK